MCKRVLSAHVMGRVRLTTVTAGSATAWRSCSSVATVASPPETPPGNGAGAGLDGGGGEAVGAVTFATARKPKPPYDSGSAW